MADDLKEAALYYHRTPIAGKLAVVPTKPMATQRDLALAYSPGVAYACNAIVDDPGTAAQLTGRQNLVAVITNGTAVLGLGNIGPLASKPVMEGKAALFKKFADIDVFDLEVAETDVDRFVDIVAALEPTFGGINLEDIKAPECFEIERKLRARMKIPVFHDDQHGTAIIVGAAIFNALRLVGKSFEDVRLVTSGAGAAAMACVDLLVAMGLRKENVILTDIDGVVWRDRPQMNPVIARYAVDTEARRLAEVIAGADVFLGVSAPGVVTPEMVKTMADRPVILALANPTPEIMPEAAREARPDAIIATGRSDYPNQVNNVLCFPFIFRGALDVGATTINEEMKIAAVKAIADLAMQETSDIVATAYGGQELSFGQDYIIPRPFDPRLIMEIAPRVAQAAMDSGVAAHPIEDFEAYRQKLSQFVYRSGQVMRPVFARAREEPKRVVFAEGEEEKTIRAAVAFQDGGYGVPVLIGREERIRDKIAEMGIAGADEIEIHNARLSRFNQKYIEFLYNRLHRKGALHRDCQRMVNQDRNVFAACMVATGDADALVTGLTRSFGDAMDDVTRVIDQRPNELVMALTMVIVRGRTVFIADTNVHELPSPEQLADIACQAAAKARAFGHDPRVAMLSFSNFGSPMREKAERVRRAVEVLDARSVDFEYDGEMSADVALDPEMRKLYPFCRLTGPANVLVMPALHTANVSYKLLQRFAGGSVIGPIIMGLEKPAQIVQMGATVSDLVNAAAIAAHEAIVA